MSDWSKPQGYYTEKVFTPADLEAMRIETLEKAAKVCEEYAAGGAGSEWDIGYLTAAQSCAAAIRSMK